jgi:hypothetical protein
MYNVWSIFFILKALVWVKCMLKYGFGRLNFESQNDHHIDRRWEKSFWKCLFFIVSI